MVTYNETGSGSACVCVCVSCVSYTAMIARHQQRDNEIQHNPATHVRRCARMTNNQLTSGAAYHYVLTGSSSPSAFHNDASCAHTKHPAH